MWLNNIQKLLESNKMAVYPGNVSKTGKNMSVALREIERSSGYEFMQVPNSLHLE